MLLKKANSVTESLSWASLGDDISVEDKIIIFEVVHTKNSLIESIDEDKRYYFESLVNMSDLPIKNQTYIVVPLLLVDNRIILLDKPKYMDFLREDKTKLVFLLDGKEKSYPPKILRTLSITNTFTFSSENSYNKFRTALALKFDIILPNSIEESLMNYQ